MTIVLHEQFGSQSENDRTGKLLPVDSEAVGERGLFQGQALSPNYCIQP